MSTRPPTEDSLLLLTPVSQEHSFKWLAWKKCTAKATHSSAPRCEGPPGCTLPPECFVPHLKHCVSRSLLAISMVTLSHHARVLSPKDSVLFLWKEAPTKSVTKNIQSTVELLKSMTVEGQTTGRQNIPSHPTYNSSFTFLHAPHSPRPTPSLMIAPLSHLRSCESCVFGT